MPWEHLVPPVLYKYLPPERLHVLPECRVRFSQRSTFRDDHELQPDFAAFGTEDEIRRIIDSAEDLRDLRISRDNLARLIATNSEYKKLAMEGVQRGMPTLQESGVFCLSERADCEQMWHEYAGGGKGFVVTFDTTHPGFDRLKTPGLIGRVSYNDEPFGTFLGAKETEGAGIFFRKRMQYSFEREWRSIRPLHRLEHHPGDIFLSPFDPASIREIIIRPDCVLRGILCNLTTTDERYKYVQIVPLGELASRQGPR